MSTLFKQIVLCQQVTITVIFYIRGINATITVIFKRSYSNPWKTLEKILHYITGVSRFFVVFFINGVAQGGIRTQRRLTCEPLCPIIDLLHEKCCCTPSFSSLSFRYSLLGPPQWIICLNLTFSISLVTPNFCKSSFLVYSY